MHRKVNPPSDQHCVQHDAQAPHVRGPARVPRVALEDLRTDVGGAAVLVGQEIVGLVLQDHSVFERLQF